MPQTSEEMLSVVLPIELTNSNGGRSQKWFNSAKIRKSFESSFRILGLAREPFEGLVKLELTRILGKNQRLWDSDSGLRGNSKELIDALVAIGWFHDDSPKWIEQTVFLQDQSQRENGPAVRVCVYETDS